MSSIHECDTYELYEMYYGSFHQHISLIVGPMEEILDTVFQTWSRPPESILINLNTVFQI